MNVNCLISSFMECHYLFIYLLFIIYLFIYLSMYLGMIDCLHRCHSVRINPVPFRLIICVIHLLRDLKVIKCTATINCCHCCRLRIVCLLCILIKPFSFYYHLLSNYFHDHLQFVLSLFLWLILFTEMLGTSDVLHVSRIQELTVTGLFIQNIL
jgi:hypothetical protein